MAKDDLNLRSLAFTMTPDGFIKLYLHCVSRMGKEYDVVHEIPASAQGWMTVVEANQLLMSALKEAKVLFPCA